jgi:hypothetical protein
MSKFHPYQHLGEFVRVKDPEPGDELWGYDVQEKSWCHIPHDIGTTYKLIDPAHKGYHNVGLCWVETDTGDKYAFQDVDMELTP